MKAAAANVDEPSLVPVAAGPGSRTLREEIGKGWDRLEAWLQAKPKWALYLMVTAVSLVVGWIDWVTGYEINLSLVYGVLVIFAGWVGGRNVGLCVAVTNAVISALAATL